MKFQFENLGLLDKAEIELSDLTIICGENNTGKTYATYAVYGFLRNWKQLLRQVIMSEISVLEKPSHKYQIDLNTLFTGKINDYLNKVGNCFKEVLHDVFAAKEDSFSETKITISIDKELDVLKNSYQRRVQGGGEILATISKQENSSILEILLVDDAEFFEFGLKTFVTDAIAEIVFRPYFPTSHISSAERTGAAIFRRELDMARTRMLRTLSDINPQKLGKKPLNLFLPSIAINYAWPVEDNVEFARQLEEIDKQKSELSQSHPEILTAFDAVIGGTYRVIKNQGLFFQANNSKTKRYTMNEASSCARALLDVGFYLRCKAKPGDLFIIDEPELNLHPKNQRAFARLIARLVNAGIKVFMTTHSDYLIKELNTLIILNQCTEHTKKIQKKYEYSNHELLNHEKVILYITEKQENRENQNVLRQVEIYPDQGMAVDTFDDTIDLMNSIQECLIYGE